jgi:membrane dipeptidase
MPEVMVRPDGVEYDGRLYGIVDALSMPTAERRWFEHWREGGLTCVNTTIAVWENASETLAVLGKWRNVLAHNSDIVAAARSVEEIQAIRASGRTAIVFGFQNTSPIEHDIELFGAFRELGVCIMQLTYNLQNYIGCGYWEENDSGISSRFGRTALKEMNAVGILIDLSHFGVRSRSRMRIRASSSVRESTAPAGRKRPMRWLRSRSGAASWAFRPIAT